MEQLNEIYNWSNLVKVYDARILAGNNDWQYEE